MNAALLSLCLVPVSIDDLRRFPPPDAVADALRQNLAYEKHCRDWQCFQPRQYWACQERINEACWRWRCWSTLSRAQEWRTTATCATDETMQEYAAGKCLECLEELQELLGADAYVQGVLPFPVPWDEE